MIYVHGTGYIQMMYDVNATSLPPKKAPRFPSATSLFSSLSTSLTQTSDDVKQE